MSNPHNVVTEQYYKWTTEGDIHMYSNETGVIPSKRFKAESESKLFTNDTCRTQSFTRPCDLTLI